MPRVVVLSRYPFTQTNPSITWTINHNLDVVHPVVDVWILNDDGTYINSDAQVTFIDSNTVVVDFTSSTIVPRGIALVT